MESSRDKPPKPFSRHPRDPDAVFVPLIDDKDYGAGITDYMHLMQHDEDFQRTPCGQCPSYFGSMGSHPSDECKATPCRGGIFMPYIKMVELRLQGFITGASDDDV